MNKTSNTDPCITWWTTFASSSSMAGFSVTSRILNQPPLFIYCDTVSDWTLTWLNNASASEKTVVPKIFQNSLNVYSLNCIAPGLFSFFCPRLRRGFFHFICPAFPLLLNLDTLQFAKISNYNFRSKFSKYLSGAPSLGAFLGFAKGPLHRGDQSLMMEQIQRVTQNANKQTKHKQRFLYLNQEQTMTHGEAENFTFGGISPLKPSVLRNVISPEPALYSCPDLGVERESSCRATAKSC